jgi:hypothetical protein
MWARATNPRAALQDWWFLVESTSEANGILLWLWLQVGQPAGHVGKSDHKKPVVTGIKWVCSSGGK